MTWSAARYDLHPQLRDLRIPTLVVVGDNDFIPIEIAQGIADAVPDARLVVIPDGGQFAHLEQPDAVHAAIAELLARIVES